MKVSKWLVVLIAGALLASIASVYAWHVVTLCFAKFLTTAAEPVSGYAITYTNFLGFSGPAYDPYMQEPESYNTFIRTTGAGSCLGIGKVRDVNTGMNQWLGVDLLGRSLILFAIFFGTWSLPRWLRNRSRAGKHRVSAVSDMGLWASVVLMPCAMLLLWYALYPRMRLGQGVFEMHKHLWWAVLVVGGGIGALAAIVDWRIELRLRRASSVCPRCRFPQPEVARAQCPECGFVATRRTVGTIVLRRTALWLGMLGVVGIISAGLWIGWGPKHSVMGIGAVRAWLLLRPLQM